MTLQVYDKKQQRMRVDEFHTNQYSQGHMNHLHIKYCQIWYCICLNVLYSTFWICSGGREYHQTTYLQKIYYPPGFQKLGSDRCYIFVMFTCLKLLWEHFYIFGRWWMMMIYDSELKRSILIYKKAELVGVTLPMTVFSIFKSFMIYGSLTIYFCQIS